VLQARCGSEGGYRLWGHHIPAILPLFSSSLQSQQCSLADTISVSLAKRPFGASASETTSAGHTYQLSHLTNGEANQTAELGIKVARFPAASSSQLTTQADTSRRTVDSEAHQGGGNYARLPGHDASCTGHYIDQQSTLAASTQPATAPACHTIHHGLPASLLHTAATIARGLTLPPRISPRHSTCHGPATQLTEGAATTWNLHRAHALHIHSRPSPVMHPTKGGRSSDSYSQH
jgi:hypothetical protein